MNDENKTTLVSGEDARAFIGLVLILTVLAVFSMKGIFDEYRAEVNKKWESAIEAIQSGYDVYIDGMLVDTSSLDGEYVRKHYSVVEVDSEDKAVKFRRN